MQASTSEKDRREKEQQDGSYQQRKECVSHSTFGGRKGRRGRVVLVWREGASGRGDASYGDGDGDEDGYGWNERRPPDGTEVEVRKRMMARTRTIGAEGTASAGSSRACLCVCVQRRTRRIKTANPTMKVLYGRRTNTRNSRISILARNTFRQSTVAVIAYPPSSILPTFKQASSVSCKMNSLFDLRSCRQLSSPRSGKDVRDSLQWVMQKSNHRKRHERASRSNLVTSVDFGRRWSKDGKRFESTSKSIIQSAYRPAHAHTHPPTHIHT